MTTGQIEECQKAWRVLADAVPSLKRTEPEKWEEAIRALTCLTCYIYSEKKELSRQSHDHAAIRSRHNAASELSPELDGASTQKVPLSSVR